MKKKVCVNNSFHEEENFDEEKNSDEIKILTKEISHETENSDEENSFHEE